MVEYGGFILEPVASKAVRTLTRPVRTIRETFKRKYRLVAPALVEGGLPTVTEISNRFNADNSKNDPMVDVEDWRLTMNAYMKIMRTT